MPKKSNTFKVSNSRVKTWRRCHYAYHLKYVKKLRRKRKSRPLMFGTLVHLILEAHANGDDPFSPIDNLPAAEVNRLHSGIEEYGDILADVRCIMEEYFEHWGDSLDYIRLRKRNAEHEFELEVEDGLVINGKIDMYARTPNGLNWLVEHKTFSKPPNEDDNWRNVQSILYTRITQLLGWCKIEGTLWDRIHSKSPGRPQVLKNGSISKRAVYTLPSRLRECGLKPKQHAVLFDQAKRNRSNYFHRIFTPTKKALVDLVYNDFLATARLMRDTEGRAMSKNIDKHCSWCEFEPICRSELRNGNADFVMEKEYETKPAEEVPAEDQED